MQMQENQTVMNGIDSLGSLPSCFVLGTLRSSATPPTPPLPGSAPPRIAVRTRITPPNPPHPRRVTGGFSQWRREKGGAAPRGLPADPAALNIYEGGGSTPLLAAAGAMK